MALAQPLFAVNCEAVLVLDNWALGTNGASVAANSAAQTGSLHAANLLSPALDCAYRSDSLVEPKKSGEPVAVIFDLGRGRAVNWVSIHHHNSRMPWRVSLYRRSGPNGAPVWVSDWHDPVVRAELTDFTYRDLRYTLGPDPFDLERWAAQMQLDSFIKTPDTFYAIRHIKIEFDATRQLYQPTDYVQVGHVAVARSFQPRINVLLDWEISYNDRSELHRVESGALMGRKRSGSRVLAFTLGYVDRDEAFERVLTGFMRKHGQLGRVFVWVEPEHRRYFYDQAMTATATSLPKVAMANLDWPAAKGWQLEETE